MTTNELIKEEIKINPIYTLEIYNSIVSTRKSVSTKNNTLYISDTDKFQIIIKNTSILGGEPYYDNSYVLYDIPNKIFVSLDDNDGHISKISTAINILKSKDIKNQKQNENNTGYFIEINEGVYNEDNVIDLIDNMELKGVGIDKTIINFNIKTDKQ